MQTDEMAREKTFNMRLTPEEWARFESVADRFGLPVASMIRMLVKNEEAAALSRASESRWQHVKDEAQEFAALSELLNLNVRFIDATWTIVLDDGKRTKSVTGGLGVWSELAHWPGSKLEANQKKLSAIWNSIPGMPSKPGPIDNAILETYETRKREFIQKLATRHDKKKP